MNIRLVKKDTEIIIENIKLFSREEEIEIIKKYKGDGPKVGPNGPNLRNNLEVASYFEERTIITFDIIINTDTSTIRSGFAIIIMYDEKVELLYDIFDKLTERQQRMLWNLKGEIISRFSNSINQSNYNTNSKKIFPQISQKTHKLYTFKRNNKEVFLCLIRKIFIPISDEEKIRQKVLLSLLNDLHVPVEFIKVEENMSHYKKGAKDRADIVVLHPETKVPWLLYELKSPSKPINDDTLMQARKYNKLLNCQYICLSNGITEKWYFISDTQLKQIKIPESLDDLSNKKVKYIYKSPYIRPNYMECKDKKIIKIHMYAKSAIGIKTPKHLHEFITNLYGFFREERLYINNPYRISDFTIIKDGIRTTSFGNVSGGTYEGVYRYFILEFPNGENNIISISIFGLTNYTSLVVAIDDNKTKHNSLQLNLDKNIQLCQSSWKVFHDGALTVGNKGGQKKAELISFYKEHLPNLVVNNKIYLGELPLNVLFDWDNTKKLIINLIRYALIRDKYRSIQKY